MTLSPDAVPAPVESQRERQGNRGHDSAGEVSNAIRLLTLRTQGLTYDQIAQQEGYANAAGARNAIMRALRRHEVEAVNDLRAVENMRLDASERALRLIVGDSQAKVGDKIRAVDALTRLSARRSRLNGLDAPLRVEVSSGAQADLNDALAELDAALREQVVPGEVTASHDEPPTDPEEQTP